METLFRLIFVFIAASALLTDNALGADEGTFVEPIQNLNDTYVVGIAEFAVRAYNRQSGKRLKLDSIKKGQVEFGAGIIYRLIIAAAGDGTATKKYEAVVYDQPWIVYRNLTSFNPV